MYGYGKFYRDSWVDYETEGHHSTFGYSPVPRDATFNAYTGEASGKMKSVVINEKYNDNVAVKYSVATESNAFNLIPMPWNSDYYNGVSFIKEVADFENRSNFEGKFTFEYAHNYEYPKLSETKEETLTFNIGGVWTAGNGIYLSFLDNIQ